MSRSAIVFASLLLSIGVIINILSSFFILIALGLGSILDSDFISYTFILTSAVFSLLVSPAVFAMTSVWSTHFSDERLL